MASRIAATVAAAAFVVLLRRSRTRAALRSQGHVLYLDSTPSRFPWLRLRLGIAGCLMDFEVLTGCRYLPRGSNFESEDGRRSVMTWAMPPPCSPSTPFGSIQGAVGAGCAPQLLTGEWPLIDRLHVQQVGEPIGLGLFASAPLASDAVLCEYTGIVRVDPPQSELEVDDYAFELPVVDPNVVISAATAGGLARLINHGEVPNCELRTVHLDGLLRVVVVTLRRIATGEQCLIHYGAPYWRNVRRRRVELASA